MATVLNADGVALSLGGATTNGIIGTSAAEVLYGTSANDAFRGNGNGDTLYGGAGDDFYNIFYAADVVVENPGEGVDTILATVSYVLQANVENLQQYGNSYGIGNNLDNVIIGGGGGAQWLDGAGGNDVLTGGAGNDRFFIGIGGGHDLITDFTIGSDRALLAVGGYTNFDQVKANLTQVGSSVLLSLGSGGEQLWFANHQISDFSGRDFMLPLDTSRLVKTFGDEFNSLSLYSAANPTGTWWTSFGSGNTLSTRTLARNGEKQVYVESSFAGTGSTPLGINPFSVHDGVVDITAVKTTAQQASALWGYQYASGMLNTKTTFAQQYGYFEVSAKLPVGKGFWPGFWLLPTDYTFTPEIDVFEALGNNSSTTYQTLHPTGSAATANIAYLDHPDQFHTYGLKWDRNYLVWYIDGVETNRMATPAEANKPMYMLLTLPVGGYWSGNPDSTTQFSSSFTIDYVRAYSVTNTAPIAVGETYGGTEDTPLVIGKAAGVLANDTDSDASDAPWLTSVLITGPAHGAVVLNKDGSFTYTPVGNYNGADSFTYAASDGLAQSTPVTVNLNVAAVNDAPTAAAGSSSTNEDTPLSGVLPTASDVDGDAISYALASAAAQGVVVVNADGSFTYTPTANYNGADSFSFSISDPSGASTTYSFAVNVAPVNDAPTAAAPSALAATEQVALDLKGSGLAIADVDGVNGQVTVTLSVGEGALTVAAGSSGAIVAGSGTGSVILTGTLAQVNALLATDATSVVIYFDNTDTPSASTQLTLSVTDSGGLIGLANSTIAISAVNDAPVAMAGGNTTPEDTALVGTLPVAVDPEGDTIAYALAQGAASGVAVVNSDGTFSYTPGANFNGADSFSFSVSDGKGGVNTYAYQVQVTPVNDAPTASGAAGSTLDNAVLTGGLPAAVDAEGDAITYALAAGAANGVAIVNANGTFSYTPNGVFHGVDGFDFTVSDPNGGVNTYHYAVTVNASNHAPVAASGAGTVSEDTVLAGALPVATDQDGDTVTYSLATGAAHGSVTVNAEGTFTYTPVANYNGADSFSFTVADPAGASNTYNYGVTVNTVNDLPVSSNGSAITAEDTPLTGLLPSASDVEGDAITYALANAAANGSVVVNANGTFSYTPTANFNGADSFSFSVSDGNGGVSVYTYGLTVTPVNDAPTLTAPANVAATEQIVLNLKGSGLAVADVDGAGAYSVAFSVGEGALTVQAGGSGATVSGSGTKAVTVTGTLAQVNALLTSDASSLFTYIDNTDTPSASTLLSISTQDSGGLIATASSVIAITAVNDAPVVVGETAQVLQGTSISFAASSLLSNDYDPEGSALTLSGVSGAVNGVVSYSAGIVTFTPTASYSGAASFTYQVSDGSLVTSGAVNLTVVSSASTYTLGGAGNDVFDFSKKLNIQLVNGQGGDDLIKGGSNNDSLNGGIGNDTIYGGAGNDTITGGAGSDIMFGGAGNDSFILAKGDLVPTAGGAVYDVIGDFERSGTGRDMLKLTGFTNSATLSYVGDTSSGLHDYLVTDGAFTSHLLLAFSGPGLNLVKGSDYVFA